MAIRTFQLQFEASRTEPLPDSARAHIVLSTVIRDNDRILLSPECRTIGEVEHEVDKLKDELDRILDEARRKLGSER